MKWGTVLVIFFLLACNNAEAPRGTLPPAQMKQVLYDMMRADELANQYMITDSSYNKSSKRAALYAAVFTANNTSRDVFEKSLNFYETRPDLMKEILDSIITIREPHRKQLQADTLAATKTDSSTKKVRDTVRKNPFRILRSGLPKTE